MIVFENKGNLDVRAIKTFGVNSKDNPDTAIGYFGTGLKYAIAVILREGGSIDIMSNGTVYTFAISRSKIRNDEFDIVTMNGEELGFTTSLGKNWKAWMAFRELYSNMLDEGGVAHTGPVSEVPPGEYTTILVKHKEMEQIFEKKDFYFLNPLREAVAANWEVEAYEKDGRVDCGGIYYKGVHVMETRETSLYDYNHKLGLTLTEDRTIRDSWSTLYHLSALTRGSQDKKFITNMVMAPPNSYEGKINFKLGGSNVDNFSKTSLFIETVGELRRKFKDVGVNPSAIELHKSVCKVTTVMPGISCYLNKIQIKQLEDAKTFCKDVLELDIDAYKLIVCKDLGESAQLGRADIEEGIMYVSKRAFEQGTKCVATTILEEYTHCEHRVEDETLEQKWIYLNQILSLGERIQGKPL